MAAAAASTFMFLHPASSDALKCEIKEREQVYYAHGQIPEPLNTKYLGMLAHCRYCLYLKHLPLVSGQCAAAAYPAGASSSLFESEIRDQDPGLLQLYFDTTPRAAPAKYPLKHISG